jgi:UDP-glucose 4-epimerase
MRVLVTGAGGNIGRVVVPALVEAGHEPVLADMRPLETPHRFLQLDVRDGTAVAAAVRGADAVVHAAALHGSHLQSWSPEEFWQTNATGTFHVLRAAADAGACKVVLCSTMGVYGAEPPVDRWGLVTDEHPVRPRDVYGATKAVCEDLAAYTGRTGGVATVALRLGMFVPETFERYGFRLLFGGVDDRDVAAAVLLSLDHDPPDGFEAFNIFADTPFGESDLAALATDPLDVLERHWPGARELVAERGLDVDELVWGRLAWRSDAARERLGYAPRFGFGEFLDALRRDDPSHYPFAGEPWWGVPR